MSETTLYPIGYGSRMVTMKDLRARHEPNMHPEYARRLFAWLESRNGKLGIGGGWRPTGTQPTRPGFAPEGKSFHQTQTFADGLKGYCAVDLVVARPSLSHRAPTWSEVPKQGTDHPDIATFGLHCNVGNEPWHMQWTDETIGGYVLDGWESWNRAGRPGPLPFPIAAIPTIPGPDFPNGQYSLFPLNPNKRTLRQTTPPMQGSDVEYLQWVMYNECKLILERDGYFGAETATRVRQVQRWNGLTQDGICGPNTWRAIDQYAAS